MPNYKERGENVKKLFIKKEPPLLSFNNLLILTILTWFVFFFHKWYLEMVQLLSVAGIMNKNSFSPPSD